MLLNSFFIPYKNDERLCYTEEYLINKGYVLADNESNADFLILPVVTKKQQIDDSFNQLLFIGMINDEVKSKLSKKKYISYFDDESFVLKNAFATAEGAVALIKENSDITIYDSDILITGFGRIGKALAKMLISMGANVTVCSRSKVSIAECKFFGVNHIEYYDLLNKDNKYDFILNTVPQIVFAQQEINNMKPNTKYFEIASFPGGIDEHYAKHIGIDVIDGSGLPKRYSKKSAGYFIGETIDRRIRGE